MLRAALQRGLDVLDRVPLGSRYQPGAQRIGLLQRWYAAQPKQRIIVAVVELERAVEEPALESAVRALCAYHPYALGVCLARDVEQLSTRPLTPADPVPLHAAGELDAWALAEELVHLPFQPGAPLFRIARADQGKRLVCAFDHIMFDGISAAQCACALARSIAASTPPAPARDEPLPAATDNAQRAAATDLQRAAATDMQRAAATDMQRAAATDMQHAAATDMQRAAATDMQRAAATDMQRAAATDMQRAAATDMQRAAAADMPLPAANDGLEFADNRHAAAAQRPARLERSAPLPPPAADADAHLPLDARLDLRPSAAQLVRALRAQPAPVPPLTARATSAPLRTRIARHEIKSMDTERLRARAHREGVSLHAAISSCALLAAAQALDVDHGRLRLHTPISLRARCRPEPRDFGVFIAGVDSDLDVTASSDPWNLARQYSDQLTRDKPDAPGQLGLLALGGDLRERAEKLERQQHGRTATLEVSNVGRVLDVPDGTVVWLTQGAHYHSPLLVLTLVESAGVVRACLSAPQPLVDDARIERFTQALREKLRQASRS